MLRTISCLLGKGGEQSGSGSGDPGKGEEEAKLVWLREEQEAEGGGGLRRGDHRGGTEWCPLVPLHLIPLYSSTPGILVSPEVVSDSLLRRCPLRRSCVVPCFAPLGPFVVPSYYPHRPPFPLPSESSPFPLLSTPSSFITSLLAPFLPPSSILQANLVGQR